MRNLEQISKTTFVVSSVNVKRRRSFSIFVLLQNISSFDITVKKLHSISVFYLTDVFFSPYKPSDPLYISFVLADRFKSHIVCDFLREVEVPTKMSLKRKHMFIGLKLNNSF